MQQFNQEPPNNHKNAQWLQWRADLLTDFLTRLYQQVVAINPELVISMAPSPYPWGLREYLQDNHTLANALRSHVYAQSVPFNAAQVKAQGFTHRRVGAEYRYIDRLGNLVTQPKFDWVDSFQQERARLLTIEFSLIFQV